MMSFVTFTLQQIAKENKERKDTWDAREREYRARSDKEWAGRDARNKKYALEGPLPSILRQAIPVNSTVIYKPTGKSWLVVSVKVPRPDMGLSGVEYKLYSQSGGETLESLRMEWLDNVPDHQLTVKYRFPDGYLKLKDEVYK